jgi:phosphocarrier protein
VPQRSAVIVTITNRLGLHARPATTFVELANAYESSVAVRRGDQVVNGKSIMEMMLLAATKGTKLEIIAEGEDAEDVCQALQELVDRHFDEE